MSPKAISKQHSLRGLQSGCLIPFFGLFLLIGLVVSYFLLVRPTANILRATGWVETPCTIISSEVETHHGNDGATYSIKITYSYQYQNQAFTGDRYHFMIGSSSGSSGKQAIVDKYPAGSQRTCYVNPRDPSESVIYRGFTWEMLFGLIPLLFVAIGGGGVYFQLRKWRQSKAREARALFGAGEPGFDAARSESDVALDESEADESDLDEAADRLGIPEGKLARDEQGRAILTSGHSPVIAFLALLVFSLFWNGIVSIFVANAVGGFRAGRPEILLSLFLIPFVLVGIGVLGATAYTFMTIFNPRPRITISKTKVALGDSFDIWWSLTGNTSSVEKLEIRLEGSEQASYRRGTSNYTDTETFLKMTLLETSDRSTIADGNTRVTVPANTMHSFDGLNNKISWSLRVVGTIRRWPDVNYSFPITILPFLLADDASSSPVSGEAPNGPPPSVTKEEFDL